MSIYCVVCGSEDVVPSTVKYEPMCRKCVKSERAMRKKASKYFLRKEMKRYDED